MFDDNSQSQATQDPAAGINPEPAPGGVLGPAPDSTPPPADSSVITPTDPAPATDTAAAAPAADDQTYNTTPLSTADEKVIQPPADTPSSDNSAAASGPVANDDLLNLKQQALQSLSPLLGHLDQSPEEKFRTTMMMIQASDDQSLIKAAYEAAQAIPDEKEKAQALLDVVNEINYFTQLGQDKS